MKEIPLTQNKIAIIDDEDFEKVSQYKWYWGQHYPKRTVQQNGTKKNIFLHNFIMGPAPEGCVVDHLYRNTLNNQKSNLEFKTPQQNCINRNTRKNKSGYKGVYYKAGSQKVWRSQIRVNNKCIHLGYFETREEAARAYNQAATMYHKQLAILNPV